MNNFQIEFKIKSMKKFKYVFYLITIYLATKNYQRQTLILDLAQ